MLSFPQLIVYSSGGVSSAFAAILGFKLSWPKIKLQNVGAGDPSSTILIDHGSYAVLHTTLGPMSTQHYAVYSSGQGVDPGGWGLDPLKICRGQNMFWPLKCHCFIQNLDNSACCTSSMWWWWGWRWWSYKMVNTLTFRPTKFTQYPSSILQYGRTETVRQYRATLWVISDSFLRSTSLLSTCNVNR